MILSQRQKVFVALTTAWALVYPFLFFAVVLVLTFGAASLSIEQQGEGPPFLFFAIFPFHCLTILITLGLMAFYLAHIIKNTLVSDTLRVIFGVGVFMMPYIAMPIYYFFFIWRDEDVPSWARPKA